MAVVTGILTSTYAMSAASALAATQRSLAKTQRQLSTGLKVSSAKDDPAYWSIAVGMRSRIGDLRAVDDGLAMTASIIGVTATALDAIRADVEQEQRLVASVQTAGIDAAAIQAEIAIRQKDIVSTAEAANFNGVNWLVTRMSGTDITREDVTNGGPRADYTPFPPPGQYSDEVEIVQTLSTTLTLGSTSSGTTVDTLVATETPDATNTRSIGAGSATHESSGDPTGYRNVGILFSPDGPAAVNLHPIELFKSFDGTEQSSAYESFSDVPSFQYASNPNPVTKKFDPYLTFTMDDDLDSPIHLPDEASVVSSALNLDVTTPLPQDLQYLVSGVGDALSSVIAGQSFLGGLANRVSGQLSYDAVLADALTAGVGSLADADMKEVSTRLAALQMQQQLGLQSLSIANAGGDLVLKLFGGP